MEVTMETKPTMGMLDLETGGTEPAGVAIFSIGLVAFTKTEIVDRVYLKLDPRWTPGFRDRSTYEWWSRQSEDAKTEALGGSVMPWDACEAISEFVALNNIRIGWAYPVRFDFGHLRELYHAVGHKFPLEFWRERDMTTFLRTALAVDPAMKNRLRHLKDSNKMAHNAVEDAITQVFMVQEAMRVLSIDLLEDADRKLLS